ncbi:hypothetical protein H4S07_000151 [Coemansia furcata]|uniref:Uncharacterized protein n=1 Tax=Coemansia furcata TaxID=417177 RepID=A0ACC1LR01_9FUNG|nr:hypothetical protein H4S07_000151 [Coemansia furcata]
MNNFNHFEQGGALYITALHRIRELGAALHQAVSESSELRHTLANYENAEANRRYTEFALRLNVDERDRALFESRQTVTVQALFIGSLRNTNTALRTGTSEHDRVVVGLQHTIAELQRTVTTLQNRDAAHVRTIDGLQRTLTDLQHANAGHVQTIDELERANADQQSQLNEAQCVGAICLAGINYVMNRFAESEYGTEIHRQSLDAAIPPSDILTDDDDSDVTDMVVDIPTAADTVATTAVIASPVIDSLPGRRLPSFDLADNARHGPLGAMYDQSRVEVTSESLLAVVKPFVFIDLDLLRDIYYNMNGCRLLSGGVSLQDFIRGFDRMEGLKFWAPRLTRADSTRPVDLNFLQRCDSEPGDLTRSILRRLGLALDMSAVVLGPVLCYTLVILCGTRVDRMTGTILEQMFAVATGEELHSLWVTTASGTHQMSGAEHCLMVKDWVKGLVEHIAMDNGLNQSLDMTKQCYRIYSRRCAAESYDSMANVAAKMLDSNEHFSQLFLGLQKADLKALCKLLVHVIDSDTSPQIKDSLRRVAGELQQRTV